MSEFQIDTGPPELPRPGRSRGGVRQKMVESIDQYDTDSSFGSGLAIASLACGIIGLATICFAPVSLILSAVGLVTGIIALRSTFKRRSGWVGLATVGIVISGIALVIIISAMIFWGVVEATR